MKSKVQCLYSISRTCLAQEFGLVSGVESIRILQMCFNLNIFLRVQRSHRVIRIQPSIRVSGTSVSAANVSLSIKFFVVVHPVWTRLIEDSFFSEQRLTSKDKITACQVQHWSGPCLRETNTNTRTNTNANTKTNTNAGKLIAKCTSAQLQAVVAWM